MMEGRWTIRWQPWAPGVPGGGYRLDGSAPFPEIPVPVVPCDDAAIERVCPEIAKRHDFSGDYAYEVVCDVLRLAGETPRPVGAMSDREAKIRVLEYERAVLVNNLSWARSTFRLIGHDDYADGIDRLQEQYGLPPLQPTLEDHYTIRRGPVAGGGETP